MALSNIDRLIEKYEELKEHTERAMSFKTLGEMQPLELNLYNLCCEMVKQCEQRLAHLKDINETYMRGDK